MDYFDLDFIKNTKVLTPHNNKDSFSNKKKSKFDLKKINDINKKTTQFNFDNINNDSFIDDYDIREYSKIGRKYSSKTINLEGKPLRMSLIDSLSKIRKKKFQKTKKEKSKNKNLVSLKNVENVKRDNDKEIVDLREEMLNRKLKNFFGKIKELRNTDKDNYDEQLKMFIDNEIDKLNDWEAREQEARINNFFSDLKLIKRKVSFGADIKFANPIKFSSTWTSFGKFK